MIPSILPLDSLSMKFSVIPLPDGRFFIPEDLVEPMYVHGYLDVQSYYRFKSNPKTLDIRTMTLSPD